MENVTQARRKFKVKLSGKQDTSKPIPALLGRGDGTVIVANQSGMDYYRAGNEESPGTVFNNRVPHSDNLPIFVGYDPVTDPDRHLFQVLSIRQTAYVDAGNQPIPQVGSHHTTHEYGGGDDVFIEWRRLMGLRVGRPVLFVLTVDWGYIYRGGTWIQAPVGATTVDLTATHAALVGTQAQMVLISLNSAGALATTNGTVVANPAILTIANCPVPPSGNIPLAAVRMYATQTAIGDTPSAPDIIDLRFPTYATMSGGWDLVGNAGTTPATNYAGTSDNQDFVLRANAIERMRLVPANSAVLFGESSHGIAALADNSVINVGDGHVATFSSVIYGTSNPSFQGFHARGTLAIPTIALTGDYLLTLGGRGYATAGWEAGARGSFNILAAEDHNVTHGTYATVRTTPIGAVATQEVARFDDLGETLPNLTASTVIYSDANKRIQSLANGVGALTNNGAGVLSWAAVSASYWGLTGNAGTVAFTNFVGTTDSVNFVVKVNSGVIGVFSVPGSAPLSDGNARGAGAIDFQAYRAGATQVASGQSSAILGGAQNTASGTYSIVLGGVLNTSSATGSAVLGGSTNTAGGIDSVACGRRGIIGAHNGTFLFADYTDADFNSVAAGEFAIRARGGFRHAYDNSNYWTAQISAAGVCTFATLPVAAGFIFTPPVTFSDNVTLTTAKWIGMGAAAGRLTFDSSGTPDTAVFSDCNIGINQAPIHRLDVTAAVVAGNTIVTGIYHLQPSSGGAILEIGYGSAYPTVNSMIVSYQNASAANGSALALLTHKNSATSDDYNIILYGNSSGNVGIGTNAPDTRLDIDAGSIEIAEMSAPSAGAANTVRIYAVDNGAGKTQLMALFSSGAAQQLAIQP